MTNLLTWASLHKKLNDYRDQDRTVYVSPDDDFEAGTIRDVRNVCPTGLQQRERPVVVVLDDQHYFALRLIDVGDGPIIDLWDFEPLVVSSDGVPE